MMFIFYKHVTWNNFEVAKYGSIACWSSSSKKPCLFSYTLLPTRRDAHRPPIDQENLLYLMYCLDHSVLNYYILHKNP